jgi:protein involved in polysaccharide export with SLBB domain
LIGDGQEQAQRVGHSAEECSGAGTLDALNGGGVFLSFWISFLLLAPSGALAAGSGGRVLTASDVVAIRIVDHPDLDTTTRVEPDGTINFPYVGRIRAAGRTEDDLGRAVERRLIELKIIAEP